MKHVSAVRYRHGPLVGTLAAVAACVVVVHGAEANPKGGSVASGDVTINQTPDTTTIVQRSHNAIINWKGFDIGVGGTARFIQPGSSSNTLNRVDSNKPSQIDGRLQANGNVWIVNPSGVVFGPTAQVDVHGIVATTSDILDSDFMSGSYDFSIPSPDPHAAVINQGTITIGEVGLAGLVAPHVRNEGMIVGTLGQVVLAGAPTFTLDFQGDGLIQFAATSEVMDAIDPGHALVENAGTIRADGGLVLLTAAAAAGIVDEVINTSGVIEARSVSQDHGVIVLHGGDQGIVTVSGRLGASGIDPGTVGGEVDVGGEKVLIAGGARIDASGRSGGGRVRVGGDPRGGGEGDTAKQTIVAPGATIAADATSVGDGGDVVVWADDRLVYAGSVSARGGADGGNGGTVETSSPGTLVATGTVDTGAVAGEVGRWLFDSLTVRIVDGSVDPDERDVPVFKNDPPDNGKATVSAQSIAQATGDIVIEATKNIIVDVPFSTQNDVFLQARTVNVKASIETPGTVTIDAKHVKSDEGAVITAAQLNIDSLAHANHPTGGDVSIETAVGKLEVGRTVAGNKRYRQVVIENTGNLTVDGPDDSGIAAGAVELTVEGTLTLDRPIVTDAEGDAVVLVTDKLINRVGPDALETPNGRSLVYSVNPRDDVTNGIPATIVFKASIETTPPESIPVNGNVILYEAPEVPEPTLEELNVITDPVTVSPAELTQSEPVALAAPSPTVFTIPPALDSAGSQDLLFSNDGNYELWGLTGPQ